jgi:hypothetical protein
MPISGLIITKDATAATYTPTGGTATTFNEDGVEVKNGKHVADLANVDFTTRANITFRNRNPSLSSDGSYSKAKRTITLVVPQTLADLSTSFNLARIELEMHPEMSAQDVMSLRQMAIQCLQDADIDSFINSGSLA